MPFGLSNLAISNLRNLLDNLVISYDDILVLWDFIYRFTGQV